MDGLISWQKAEALASVLREFQARIQRRNAACMGTEVSPAVEDAQPTIRMVLWSPSVLSEVRTKHQVQTIRVRLAFPSVDLERGGYVCVREPVLEIYDEEGEPITEPAKLTVLEPALANAIQVEVMQFILECQGFRVPFS